MSEKVAIKKSTLEAIGEAVRGKEGSTELIPVNDLADRITAIPSASGENKLARIIDGTVTELTEDDFKNVTIIRPYAFAYCKSLQKVVIPEGVTKISNNAFKQTNQMSVTIPVSVKTVEDYAFDFGFTSGTFIYKGTIADWCDMDISSIQAFAPANRKLYVTNALGNRELLEKSIVIDMVTEIKKYVFSRYKHFTTLAIGGKVQTIGFRAFDYNTKLTNLEIGDSVISIGNYAFEGCNVLSTVSIGSGVTSIGEGLFNSCPGLMNFAIASPITISFGLRNSTNLTIDSLKNIVNALADYSGTENEGKYKLTLNSTCNATLEAEGATAPNGLTWIEYAQVKGWNIS